MIHLKNLLINLKTNKMKQTAVEWLEKELNAIRLDIDKNVLKFIDKSLEKAKEMEKQQIIDAGNTCALKQHIHNRKVDLMSLEELEQFALEDTINFGEEYYNETYENNRIA
jgi:hypothetical protein